MPLTQADFNSFDKAQGIAPTSGAGGWSAPTYNASAQQNQGGKDSQPVNSATQSSTALGGLAAKLFPGLADLLNGGVNQYIKNFNDPNSQQNVNRENAMKPENLAMGFMGGGDMNAVAGGLPGAVVKGTTNVVQDVGNIPETAKNLVSPDQDPLALTSKITGATTPKAQLNDLASMQALQDSGYLDGVTDTPGLKNAVSTKISDNLQNVTGALKNAPNADATINADQMAEHLKNTDSTTDYIKTALQHLQQQYTDSLQDPELKTVNALIKKYDNGGLTANDINELSKEYGSEFSSKSFTKAGVEKVGVSADKAETVRTNLKSISRDMMPDEATRQIDQETSNLIDTQSRLEKQAKSVLNSQSNTPASSSAQRMVTKANNLRNELPIIGGGGMKSIGAQGTADTLKMESLLGKHIGLLSKLLLK